MKAAVANILTSRGAGLRHLPLAVSSSIQGFPSIDPVAPPATGARVLVVQDVRLQRVGAQVQYALREGQMNCFVLNVSPSDFQSHNNNNMSGYNHAAPSPFADPMGSGGGGDVAPCSASVEGVASGINMARTTACEAVVAIGNDDVIDLAKVVAAVATTGARGVDPFCHGKRVLGKPAGGGAGGGDGIGGASLRPLPLTTIPTDAFRGSPFSSLASLPWETEAEIIRFVGAWNGMRGISEEEQRMRGEQESMYFRPYCSIVDADLLGIGRESGGTEVDVWPANEGSLRSAISLFAQLADLHSMMMNNNGEGGEEEEGNSLETLSSLIEALDEDMKGGGGGAEDRQERLVKQWEGCMRSAMEVGALSSHLSLCGPTSTLADCLRGEIALPFPDLCSSIFSLLLQQEQEDGRERAELSSQMQWFPPHSVEMEAPIRMMLQDCASSPIQGRDNMEGGGGKSGGGGTSDPASLLLSRVPALNIACVLDAAAAASGVKKNERVKIGKPKLLKLLQSVQL